MKHFYIFILILLSPTIPLFGQSLEEFSKEVDSLNVILTEIDADINGLGKKREEIQKRIIEATRQKNKLELMNEDSEPIPVTINHMGGILRDAPTMASNVMIEIPKGDTVLILNWYESPFFKAAYKEHIGFISHSTLDDNIKIEAIVNSQSPEKSPKKSSENIVKGSYWIGMTRAMAMESLGNPDKMHRSEGVWGVSEQWIYNNIGLYLYFENGKLTATQR